MHVLETLMQQVNGGSFIGIDARTEVPLLGGRQNPMKGRVQKVMKGANVMVFQNKSTNAYQNMVNKRLQEEGLEAQFEPGPRTWGERIPGTPFVTHNGELYLEVIFLHSGETSYELDGQPIEQEDIIGFPKPAKGGEQDGLKRKVILRTFKLNSLTGITINKQVHDLTKASQ